MKIERQRDPGCVSLRSCIGGLLLLSMVWGAGCASVLGGRNLTRQIDGKINDSDNSTTGAGSYTSQQASAGREDGLAEAKSTAPSHKKLKGFVRLQINAASPGPFSGLPTGNSNQKARSEFTLAAPTRLQFDALPKLRININRGGQVTVDLAMWVLDGPQITATAVPGSVMTAHYTFAEDPNDPSLILFTITHSNGLNASGPMSDDTELMDTLLSPRIFNAGPGNLVAQFELNIQATGETDFTLVEGESEFDLLKVP